MGGIGNIWGVIFGGVVLGFYDRVLTSEASNWLHGLGTALNAPVISPALAAIDLSQYKFGIFGLALVITQTIAVTVGRGYQAMPNPVPGASTMR